MVEVQQEKKESTIVIKSDIRERLKEIGYKGQTYNDIITKLLESKGSNKNNSLDRSSGNLKSNESSNYTLE